MEASRDVGRLIEIMAALRSPTGGCPWDVEQTFDTIAPYTIEEAYEVADAIERRDGEDLREELGDLLLQVVYHARLAEEIGLFDFADVVEAITAKMIRRHPHVFGDAEARTARSAKGQWERIKSEERADKARRRAEQFDRLSETLSNVDADAWRHSPAQANSTQLGGIPPNLPALTLSLKMQQKAAAVGFDWDAEEPIRAKIREELDEFHAASQAGDKAQTDDEMGDILFSVVNLARFHRIDPELALRRSASKFRRRFNHIESRIMGDGISFEEAGLELMESLWAEAKLNEAAKLNE